MNAYRVVKSNASKAEDDLNKELEDGWQLVTATAVDNPNGPYLLLFLAK